MTPSSGWQGGFGGGRLSPAGQGSSPRGHFCLSLPDLSACQVLTIAATEPISLLYSQPPKPTQARGKLLLLSAPGRQEDLGPEAPGPAPKTQGPAPEASSESLAGPSAEEDFSVDFEKIYKYLSSISRGGQGPELSPAGEKGGADDLGVGVSGGKPRPSLTRPLSIHHQSQLWSLTCSWHFLRSCPACPALPWLNICQIRTYA